MMQLSYKCDSIPENHAVFNEPEDPLVVFEIAAAGFPFEDDLVGIMKSWFVEGEGRHQSWLNPKPVLSNPAFKRYVLGWDGMTPENQHQETFVSGLVEGVSQVMRGGYNEDQIAPVIVMKVKVYWDVRTGFIPDYTTLEEVVWSSKNQQEFQVTAITESDLWNFLRRELFPGEIDPGSASEAESVETPAHGTPTSSVDMAAVENGARRAEKHERVIAWRHSITAYFVTQMGKPER